MNHDAQEANSEGVKRPTLETMRARAHSRVETLYGEIEGLLDDLQKMLKTEPDPDNEDSIWGYYRDYTKDDVVKYMELLKQEKEKATPTVEKH